MALKINDIDIDNMQYIKTKTTDDSYKLYRIKYNKEDFVFQTNKIENNSKIREIKGTTTFAELEINLNEKDELYKFLSLLENYIIDSIKENSDEWFTLRGDEQIKFKSILRKSNKDNIFKIKLVNNDSYTTRLYRKENDINMKEFTLSELLEFSSKDKHVRFVLEIYGLCIRNNHVSLIIFPHKLLFSNDIKKAKPCYDFDLSEENVASENLQEYLDACVETAQQRDIVVNENDDEINSE